MAWTGTTLRREFLVIVMHTFADYWGVFWHVSLLILRLLNILVAVNTLDT